MFSCDVLGREKKKTEMKGKVGSLRRKGKKRIGRAEKLEVELESFCHVDRQTEGTNIVGTFSCLLLFVPKRTVDPTPLPFPLQTAVLTEIAAPSHSIHERVRVTRANFQASSGDLSIVC